MPNRWRKNIPVKRSLQFFNQNDESSIAREDHLELIELVALLGNLLI